MTSLHAHPILACVLTALVCVAALFARKDRTHSPIVIYWASGWRDGYSEMGEEVSEQRALVWYHGGLPTFEWRRRDA